MTREREREGEREGERERYREAISKACKIVAERERERERLERIPALLQVPTWRRGEWTSIEPAEEVEVFMFSL